MDERRRRLRHAADGASVRVEEDRPVAERGVGLARLHGPQHRVDPRRGERALDVVGLRLPRLALDRSAGRLVPPVALSHRVAVAAGEVKRGFEEGPCLDLDVRRRAGREQRLQSLLELGGRAEVLAG